jgi:hypothetical protein
VKEGCDYQRDAEPPAPAGAHATDGQKAKADAK